MAVFEDIKCPVCGTQTRKTRKNIIFIHRRVAGCNSYRDYNCAERFRVIYEECPGSRKPYTMLQKEE